MTQEWCPFAMRWPGPMWKHGYGNTPEPGHKVGAVYHSAEGDLDSLLGVLTSERQASWTFSNPKSGPLLQHYPVGYHTWANGSLEANVRYVSCESEGVAGEPLMESQVQNLIDLTAWLQNKFGWDRLERRHTLWEHRELVNTSCPSGRIPWDHIMEVLSMPDEETRRRWADAADVFNAAAVHAILGLALPPALKAKLRYLLA